MSKSSIYETAWLDLVFEGKNKEYGAYQLRQENSRTTFKALFFALVLLTALATISLVLSSIGGKTIPKVPEFLSPTIEMRDIIQPEIEQPKQEPQQAKALPPIETNTPQATIKDPQVVSQAQANPNVPTNEQFSNSNASPNGVPGGTGTAETPATGTGEGTAETPSIINTTYTAASVDRMPTYPGGMDGFYKYVGKNFKTPEEDLGSNGLVKVLVSFVIEKDGTMSNIQVLRNPGFGLDKEAIRVLKSMKAKWEPGSIKGQPVRVVYNLPIAIKVP